MVLATRDSAARKWFLSTVSKLLVKHSAEALAAVTIDIYVTGEVKETVHYQTGTTELKHSDPDSPSMSEPDSKNNLLKYQGSIKQQERRGRPQLPHMIEQEAVRSTETGDSVGVFDLSPCRVVFEILSLKSTWTCKRIKIWDDVSSPRAFLVGVDGTCRVTAAHDMSQLHRC